MRILPAIDIKDGKCVRLLQGRADDAKIYGEDPTAMAVEWQNQGAKMLHLVNLNGAFDNSDMNDEVIREIIKKIDIPVQIGGGIRDMLRLERYIRLGAKRVIIGTAAIDDEEFLKQALKEYPKRIIIGIDAKDGYMAIKGWTQVTETRAIDLALRTKKLGADMIVYTDISRDGMMTGPNIEATVKMIKESGMHIIASGGMSSIEDIKKVSEIGAYGVILGKSIYEKRITLSDALKYENGDGE